MSGFVGADVDQLRALSRRCTAAADQLRAIGRETSTRLNAVRWTGADGDRFRTQWQGESTGRLRSAADALAAAAAVLQKNADEQDQASSAGGGINGGPFGSGSNPAWGWPGDGGATPWFLRPGGGLPDAPAGPMAPSGHNGAEPQWNFPNPFGVYRDFVGKTPIWPITIGTAVGMTPVGDALTYADGAALALDDRLGLGDKAAEAVHMAVDFSGSQLRQAGFDSRNAALYLGGVAVSQWKDVVSEFSKADFGQATVARNVDFITAHPGEAFSAARDAVLDYIPKLVSNFSFNPFGK